MLEGLLGSRQGVRHDDDRRVACFEVAQKRCRPRCSGAGDSLQAGSRSAEPPQRPWRSLEEVEFVTLEWVDWFNHRRLLEPIGDIPPAEFKAIYYEEQVSPAMEAGLK
jgi:transposase InsO family protein